MYVSSECFSQLSVIIQLLQEKHFSSCTCKVQSIQLLLQLWIHNDYMYFQNFPTKLVLQIALVFVTLYSDTLSAPSCVHSILNLQTSVSMNANQATLF